MQKKPRGAAGGGRCGPAEAGEGAAAIPVRSSTRYCEKTLAPNGAPHLQTTTDNIKKCTLAAKKEKEKPNTYTICHNLIICADAPLVCGCGEMGPFNGAPILFQRNQISHILARSLRSVTKKGKQPIGLLDVLFGFC
jgi:hypothetical protein